MRTQDYFRVEKWRLFSERGWEGRALRQTGWLLPISPHQGQAKNNDKQTRMGEIGQKTGNPSGDNIDLKSVLGGKTLTSKNRGTKEA